MANRSVRLMVMGAAAAVSLVAAPALAHHSFAMYDLKKTVTLKGEVKEFHWTNPHTFIDLTVMEGGKPVVYELESQQVRLMTRSGWKRDSLKAGDKVEVAIHPLRDGGKGGHFLRVTMPDGKIIGTPPIPVG